MKGRLPTVLSATALLIALASLTPVGQAARDAITPKARFALNSDRVDGIHASRLPKAGRLLALGTTKKFPASVFSGAERPRARDRRERSGLVEPEGRLRQLPDRQARRRRRRTRDGRGREQRGHRRQRVLPELGHAVDRPRDREQRRGHELDADRAGRLRRGHVRPRAVPML